MAGKILSYILQLGHLGAGTFPPASICDAHLANAGRLIFELCRISTGTALVTDTAASSMVVAARTASVSLVGAKPGLIDESCGSITATTAWVPTGPTPTIATQFISGSRWISSSGPPGPSAPVGGVTIWCVRP